MYHRGYLPSRVTAARAGHRENVYAWFQTDALSAA
jgi:hypothetical protein